MSDSNVTSFVLAIRCYFVSPLLPSVPPIVPLSVSVPVPVPVPVPVSVSLPLSLSVRFLQVPLGSFLSSLSWGTGHIRQSQTKASQNQTDLNCFLRSILVNMGYSKMTHTSNFLSCLCDDCCWIVWGQPGHQIRLHVPVIRKTTVGGGQKEFLLKEMTS